MGRDGGRMTAAYRVTVAERQDIAEVSVSCPECGAAVTVKSETARVPTACPSCGRPYEEGLQSALAALGRFHREAGAVEAALGKSLFSFEIKDRLEH
jgi:endogenous inhibitor of DNA gyrase (YacG/DUF329 family)